MASIIKFLKTIRNNWKKSAFAACAITYGANYAKESYEIQSLMEKYCQEALKYGMQPLQPSEAPRKVLVVLNPTANRRKAIKQFEQYCVPILHLAGISVDVIQTKTEGHARTILEEHEDKADAIVIAGGDGTISESITGLLRRGDNHLPIGVLPLGRQNTFAHSLFANKTENQTIKHVRSLAEASMAIVRERTKPADVLKIEMINADGTAPNKPVFALSGVEWGSYRDAHSKLDKYWYFGKFRKYATYIFNGYKSNINWECVANISYTPPCSGCSNCYKETRYDVPAINETQQNSGRWWSSFVRKNQSNQLQLDQDELEFVVNENCTKQQKKSISTTDFNLRVGESDKPELVLKLGPPASEVTYLDFLTEGWAAENGANRTIYETIEARQIEVQPDDRQTYFYSIDNEDFEVKPIRVTLIPKLIKVFCMNQ